MKNFRFITITLIVLCILVIPVFVSAAEGIVPECKQEPCENFGSLIQLAKNLLEFFFIIGTSIAALAFAWAGILYLTSGGNPAKAEQAKKIFWTVLWGYVIVVAAWFIVDFILDNLSVNKDYSILEG